MKKHFLNVPKSTCVHTALAMLGQSRWIIGLWASVYVLHAIESANFWWPANEWCSQCPVLNSPAQLLWIPVCGFFIKLIHLIFGLPLFMLFSIFPRITVFSKEPCLFMMCPAVGQLPFLSFLPPAMFQVSFVLRLTCSSSWQSKGIHGARLQHHISK